jgi:ATP-dependent DNA helicase RecG
LNEFLLRKAGKSWDDVVEEGATIADINEDSVRKFIADSRDKGRIPDTDGLNILQVLDKLRLADGSKLKAQPLFCLARIQIVFTRTYW